MCRIRTFYECSDGTMGWAEIVLSYDEETGEYTCEPCKESEEEDE